MNGWTPARARRARLAAVHAWEDAAEVGTPEERAYAWAAVERALAREREVWAAEPAGAS